MTTGAADEINRLFRGISTDHVETVRDAWRTLLASPTASVPEVVQKLESSAWQDNSRGPLSRYFGILLALLSELDKEAFREEITRLKREKLHPVHRRTLNLMAKRLDDTPAAYLTGNIPVFIAVDVAEPQRIIRNLLRWSKTKGLSLENVTRIDVFTAQPDLDYLGKYNLFFSGIVLTAPTTRPKGIERWLQTSEGEFTFYHEVGHHVHKHSEGGKVEEQEQEADDYARAMMRNARPVLTGIGRCVGWFLKPLLEHLIKGLEVRTRRDNANSN